LEAYLGSYAIACKQSDCSGEVRARTGAAYSYKIPVQLEFLAMAPEKLKRSVTVIKTSRERIFGR
jgi:hypothetical protein